MKKAYLDQWKAWVVKATGQSLDKPLNTQDSESDVVKPKDLNKLMQDVYRKNTLMGTQPESEVKRVPTYRFILGDTISSMFGANEAVASESRGSVDWERMDQAILIAKAKYALLKLALAQETPERRKSYWKQFSSWLEVAKEKY